MTSGLTTVSVPAKDRDQAATRYWVRTVSAATPPQGSVQPEDSSTGMDDKGR